MDARGGGRRRFERTGYDTVRGGVGSDRMEGKEPWPRLSENSGQWRVYNGIKIIIIKKKREND